MSCNFIPDINFFNCSDEVYKRELLLEKMTLKHKAKMMQSYLKEKCFIDIKNERFFDGLDESLVDDNGFWRMKFNLK